MAWGLSASAQVIPHVTGTFLTPGGATPSAAGLRTILTINGTPVYGTLDFVPYDSQGRRAASVNCGGVNYAPQNVRGWIRGDGQIIDGTGALGVDLLPQAGCSPAGLVMRATIRLAPSADGRIQGVTWFEQKQLTQTAALDWGALPIVTSSPAQYTGYYSIQDEGAPLPQRNILDIAGPGASCADDAVNLRTICNITAGGGGGGGSTEIQTNGADIASQTPVNFRDNATVTWTNPSLGNVEASIAAGGITNTMI